MGKLIKTFSDGHVAIATSFVHAPGYTLTVSNYSTPGHIQDGWYYVTDDINDESLVSKWVQPVSAESAYALGDIVIHNNTRWISMIKNNVWQPGVSGWSDADASIPTWIQPTGAHDAYSKNAVVKYNNELWASLIDANVWQPGVSGWRKSAVVPPSGVVPVPAWVQPTGAHDAYPIGARVSHNNKTWTNTTAANVWEPGVFGWVAS